MNSLFRVSAIGSYLAVHDTLTENATWTIEQARRALSARSYSGAGLDWGAIERFRGLVESPLPKDRASAFRSCLSKLIEHDQPGWLALLFSGRDIAARTLDPDTLQCFEVAGAFDAIPAPEVVEWLDGLAMLALGAKTSDNLAKGREAERLSLQHELARVEQTGIKRPVEWVALNDNQAGYDIRSWTHKEGVVVPKLIEVKGYSGGSVSFFLTRNEWDTARSVISPYVFQLWSLNTGKLNEITVSDVYPHIPIDKGYGAWQSVSIKLA